jgi:y4mF family transcriptional regulator
MKIDDAQTFGKVIKQYRKRQHISQSHLAAIANTGMRFISDLESGKPTVQLDKALRIAFLLGITLETPDAAGEPQ